MGDFLDRMEYSILPMIDWIYSLLPRPLPTREQLNSCRVIAHRGEYDNIEIFENTLAAFEAAVEQGVWGIEFDIRWTRDLEPVVIHDRDLQRVFTLPLIISKSTLADIKQACPQVPTLTETIRRYGGRVHLMVEVKQEPYPDPQLQNRILREQFSALQPGEDFHVLGLSPAVFRLTTFAPQAAFLPVARLNVLRFSRLALGRSYAGVAGHYALLGSAFIRRHHSVGQKIGTGYIGSQNALYRELGRGVDWIFSNRAGAMQALIRRAQVSAS